MDEEALLHILEERSVSSWCNAAGAGVTYLSELGLGLRHGDGVPNQSALDKVWYEPARGAESCVGNVYAQDTADCGVFENDAKHNMWRHSVAVMPRTSGDAFPLRWLATSLLILPTLHGHSVVLEAFLTIRHCAICKHLASTHILNRWRTKWTC